jgi:hypothetical protein
MAGVNNQDTQQPKRAPITISGYPQAALDMMRARHPDYDQVMGGGNQVMQGAQQGGIPAVASVNVFQQGGNAMGKFQPQPVQTGAAPVTDFTQMPKQEEFVPQGSGYANPALGPVQTPYMGDAADNTPQPQTSFEGMKQPTGWNEDGTPSYDALSSALSGYQTAQGKQAPEFEADPSQRDGGFFGWLGKLIPKNRPGMREGETPDEYDRRMTTNRENIAAFADAIRHMANIVNTSKGAPLQQFNDPTAMMEQGYQNRKAQRQKEAAAASDAAYKQAEFDLENRKAQADKVYKEYLMGLRGKNAQLAKDKFDYRRDKDAASAQYKQEQDKQKQDNWERQFKFREQQAAISNGLRQQSINKRGSGRSGGGKSGSGKSGGGSSNNYPLYNPVTGQTEHFKNEKSWIARAAELGYKIDTPSSSTTSQEVYSRGGIKKVLNTTRGNSIATQIGKQTAQKKAAAKAAAQKKAAPKGSGGGKPTQKPKNGYKNTKKLGL